MLIARLWDQQFSYEICLSISQCRVSPDNGKEVRYCPFGMLRFPNTGCILFPFFSIFCCKFNNETCFYTLTLCKTATDPVALISDNETSVFYMDDVFEVLSKLNVHVQGVRTICVGFKTKLKIFFRHSRGL